MTSISLPAALPGDSTPSKCVEADVARSQRKTRLAIFSIVALTVLAGLPGLGGWCRLTPDSFTYLDAARCLRETGGYSPFRMIAPPGFPTLLAPLLTFGDLPLWGVRLLNLSCWIATSVLTFLLFRRSLGRRGAWLTAALTATSPALATQSTTLLSEPAFMPMVLACLLLVEPGKSRSSSKWFKPIALALLCAAAIFIRAMGIVLAPILAVAILTRSGLSLKRRAIQTIAFAVVLIVPSAIWERRQSVYPGNNSYSQAWLSSRPRENTDSTGLALQAERLARFGPMRLRDIKSALVPPRLGWRAFEGPIAPPASVLVGGFIMTLTFWRCWRVRSAADFFVLATLGMLCLWPYNEGTRMVTPLLPMFFAYIVWFFLGATNPAEYRPRVGRLATIAVIGVLIVQFCELGLSLPALESQRDKADARIASMQCIRGWQKQKLPASATLACIVRPREQAKTLLVGGSYLSRRRIVQFIDSAAPTADDWASIEAPYCFIQSNILGDLKPPDDWRHIGVTEGFDVFSRDVRISTTEIPPSARNGG